MTRFVHRKFNSVELLEGVVVKTGKSQKILAEVDWYNSVPEYIKKYCPKIFSWTDTSYRMEYVPDYTLASMWVSDLKPLEFWQARVRDVLKLVADLYATKRINFVRDGLLLDKSFDRTRNLPYEEQCKTTEFISYLSSSNANKVYSSIVHGDLCFSNIMWGQTRKLTIIDPRGLDSDGFVTIYGNILYDMAKLFHSIDGGYDFIVHGVEPTEEQVELKELVSKYFIRELRPVMDNLGITYKDLLACTGLLFYSMLPLHAESEERVNKLMEVGNSYYSRFRQIPYNKEQ